jgi:Flp pilus assembly protein TadG
MNSRIKVIRTHGRRGNAVIEFSIMAVVLLLLCCGVADFSRLPVLANLAKGAAMAGTQYAALSPAHAGDLTGAQNTALAATGNYPGATAVATQICACSIGGAHVSCPASCGASGTPETYVQVVVTIPFQTVINYPWVPNPITISQYDVKAVQ